MQLNSLHISQFRNLNSVHLDLNPRFNLFYGENGSGKTSLLEAIHVLATGRSFKAREFKRVVSFGAESCVISGEVVSRDEPEAPIRLGVERFQTGRSKIRLMGEDCHSIARLSQILPVQLVNSESYALLEASPDVRRKFLNWIMFHVEPSFHTTWQRFKRALEQRNAALKAGCADQDVRIWDLELIETGKAIDTWRQEILSELIPSFNLTVQKLLKLRGQIVARYQSGWKENRTLEEALEDSFNRDRLLGYTTVGPHRADIELLVDDVPAKALLSRGQLKLFISALLISRANVLYQHQSRHCVFLIDDLCSELDKRSTGVLLGALCEIDAQVLITCIEKDPTATFLGGVERSFEVKQGEVFPELATVI